MNAETTPADTTPAPAARGGVGGRGTALDLAIRYGFPALPVGVGAFFAVFASGFAGPRSAVFIFRSVAITGILALGVAFTPVVGGFDLSLGAVAASAMMLSAYVMVVLEQPAGVAVMACVAMGALIGLVDGLLIVDVHVPDLPATLGMMFLLVGLQRIPTEGRSISTGMTLPDGSTAQGMFSELFLAMGRHRIGVVLEDLVPIPVVFLVAVGVAVG